jgi:hypothetical protein
MLEPVPVADELPEPDCAQSGSATIAAREKIKNFFIGPPCISEFPRLAKFQEKFITSFRVKLTPETLSDSCFSPVPGSVPGSSPVPAHFYVSGAEIVMLRLRRSVLEPFTKCLAFGKMG